MVKTKKLTKKYLQDLHKEGLKAFSLVVANRRSAANRYDLATYLKKVYELLGTHKEEFRVADETVALPGKEFSKFPGSNGFIHSATMIFLPTLVKKVKFRNYIGITPADLQGTDYRLLNLAISDLRINVDSLITNRFCKSNRRLETYSKIYQDRHLPTEKLTKKYNLCKDRIRSILRYADYHGEDFIKIFERDDIEVINVGTIRKIRKLRDEHYSLTAIAIRVGLSNTHNVRYVLNHDNLTPKEVVDKIRSRGTNKKPLTKYISIKAYRELEQEFEDLEKEKESLEKQVKELTAKVNDLEERSLLDYLFHKK